MSSNPQTSGETHTTALVLLVLFTVFVLVTALGGGDIWSSPDDSPDTQAPPTSATDTSVADRPYNQEDLPPGIPVDEDAVVENRMVSRGAGEAMEQVISFESDRSADELTRAYQGWIADNGYTLEKQRIGSQAASLAATNGSRALIVMISYLTASDSTHVEIINYPRS